MVDEAKQHEVTVGELGRNVRDFRTDMQITVSKLETAVHEVRSEITRAPYVNTAIFEEVRKSQGERIGELEDTVRRVNAVAWGAVISMVVSVTGGVVLALLVAGVR
jgi:hypothetical protein